ncbi:hypothetical protein SynA1825c_01604 [Synechococcus sp. A18-25c]|nr:putative conserved secreted protein [Synechococcus sp. A15-60]QNJ19908.1 hypothetical protein SynA1825c_01604 [Synechococcus sp. A18-25c]|tara:strand:+ start:1054 stop:1173 length:120 start_codon:yes stop_codon:yes gene_type:complete
MQLLSFNRDFILPMDKRLNQTMPVALASGTAKVTWLISD